MLDIFIPSVFSLLCLLLAVTGSYGLVSTHVVNTTLGDVLGSTDEVTVHGDNGTQRTAEFVRYLAIPYAEPPVGDLRLSKPVAKTPWTTIHNGTVPGPICYHGIGKPSSGPVSTQNLEISEDCLTLDIYAPIGTINSSGLFPVMVFFPPEASSSYDYPGNVLSARGDVIYVAVNFRTALMGYFSLGNQTVPGNFGLWDQHLAIKWVHTHISSFGGDSARVTLVSVGQGTSSVIFQAMYPGNRGLIHRVIAHSGSPLPTYRTSSFLQEPTGEAVAKALGCARATSMEIVSCIRKMSLAEIDIELSTAKLSVAFTAVIDGEFIIEKPQNILSGNDSRFKDVRDMFASVDFLTGIDNMEGGTHVARIWTELLGQNLDTFQVNRTVFDKTVVPVAIELIYGKNVSKSIVNTVIFQYTDVRDPQNETKIRDSVVQLSTDLDTSVPVIKTANFHAALGGNTTYLYQFSAKLGIDNPLTPSWLRGANHGDDIYFLLGFSSLELWEHTAEYVPSEMEIQTANILMSLWANFVGTGDPNLPNPAVPNSPTWLAYSSDNSAYLDIGLGQVSSDKYFREPYMRFWTQLIPDLLASVEVRDGTDTNDTCVVYKGPFSPRFKVTGLTADNIIIALIILSACLFLAFALFCSLALAKNTFFKYTIKVV